MWSGANSEECGGHDGALEPESDEDLESESEEESPDMVVEVVDEVDEVVHFWVVSEYWDGVGYQRHWWRATSVWAADGSVYWVVQ